MITKSKKGIFKPKEPFAGSITNTVTPTTVIDALANPIWYKAMTEEFAAFQQNNTWSLVPATPIMHVVGSKWIFTVKYKLDSTFDGHKAILIAQGFT